MWLIDSETNHNDPLNSQTSPQASNISPLPPVSLSSHLFTNLFAKSVALSVSSNFLYLNVKTVFLVFGLCNASLLYIKQTAEKSLKCTTTKVRTVTKQDCFLSVVLLHISILAPHVPTLQLFESCRQQSRGLQSGFLRHYVMVSVTISYKGRGGQKCRGWLSCCYIFLRLA